ncbi:MAG: 4Fe-4S binding protein, partial [Schwartzia sp.]|nr:4Fe-4S binding protein [Schwartzia sp. (in: firmicutes)]
METTQVTKFRREVLRRIAQYTWNDELPDHVYDIIYQTVRDDTQRVRCCVHKERAVLKNRIQMALWQPLKLNIINAANAALAGDFDKSLPVMDVLPDACDSCPIDRYYVTDVCRHCIQHKCIDNCPKHAISIQNNRAFIDRDVCIECGRCSKSCPYGAIIEINRPCIQACALGAMSASEGEDTRTVIDHEKCVSCGNCRSACPFGALEERSMIVPLLLALKKKQRPVVAMLAPSFVGQLGMKVTPAAIVDGLRALGFTAVVE